MRMSRASWLAAIICGLWALGALPAGSKCAFLAPAAWGQNFGARTVSGAVLDANEQPVAGATVFLKNLKTKAIRSYTSAKDGRFHFAQVNMADDYDLWAEKDGRKTAIKTVSSWDARKEFETELRMK